VQYYQVNEKQQEVPQKEPRLETQKAIAEAFNKRGVRLDAYLDDGTHKLFFSTVGTKGEISDGLREILRYINDPKHFKAHEAMPRLIKRIDQAVSEAKMDDEWRRAYMTYQVHQRDAELRGEKRGIAIGEKRGMAIGEKRGEKRNALETAKRLLMRHMDRTMIAEVTGLSEAEVQELARKCVQ